MAENWKPLLFGNPVKFLSKFPVRDRTAILKAIVPMYGPKSPFFPASKYAFNLQVGVHIADVTHFVRPGTSMDAEAAERGTTVYLCDK